jgi:hypothetical protein
MSSLVKNLHGTTSATTRLKAMGIRKNPEWKRNMRQTLRAKVIAVCNEKIAKKGETVGLSFYAFFANRNDNAELLMEAAEWWIKTHELDHFEKAVKIRDMISAGA